MGNRCPTLVLIMTTSFTYSSRYMKRVAVIGAGASGLISSQVLLQEGFQVTIIEKNDYIGGTWKYFPKQDSQGANHGIQTNINQKARKVSAKQPKVNPMYGSLITNLPKQIMAFNEDNLFPDDLPSFISHAAVYDYLLAFSKKHQLERHIQLSTEVVDCRPLVDIDSSIHQMPQWKVTCRSVNGKMSESIFDFVLVCSGHFDVPSWPSVSGLDSFDGTVTHAREYDTPSEFVGSRVLVVGSRSSGTDIARELATAGCEVHVSERSRTSTVSTESESKLKQFEELNQPASFTNVHHAALPLTHHSAIKRIVPNSKTVEFEDGSIADVDVIIFCTGYLYHFPYLRPLTEEITSSDRDSIQLHSSLSISRDKNKQVIKWTGSAIASSGSRVVPELHKQLFHIPHPSLAFIGLPYAIFPFFFFYLQAVLVSKVFSAQVQLPPRDDMYQALAEFEQSIRERDLYLRTQVTVDSNLQSGHVGSADVNAFDDMQAKIDRNYHYMGGDLQIQYLHSLVHTCGESLPICQRERLLLYIKFLRDMYEDVIANRPAYTGAPDDYRRRNYVVDKISLKWSVQ